MNLEGTADGASRFAAYVGELTSVIGPWIGRDQCEIIAQSLWSQKAAGAWNRSQR